VSRIAETGSTNTDLATAGRRGAASGTVLVADHQTSGRGRLDRTWTAPPGTSLAISVLLTPPTDVPATRWLWLPLIAGLAVREAVIELGAADVGVKWPNDVLIGDRKVCGILSERVACEPAAAVIGMGINTTLAADQLPVPTATSLALAGARSEPDEVVVAVVAALGRWYSRWLDGEDLRDAFNQGCSTVGRTVRVERGAAAAVEGVAVGVDHEGRLLVRTSVGVQPFAAGDVVHLR
jgi:BirA family biotin operon repressor/biotin-[acetyl-CoA-carboxylase] ligase